MYSSSYSVRAARASRQPWLRRATVLVAHDFDQQGIGIADLIATEVPRAIDLGLRLDDVEDRDLDSEAVSYRNDRWGTWSVAAQALKSATSARPRAVVDALSSTRSSGVSSSTGWRRNWKPTGSGLSRPKTASRSVQARLQAPATQQGDQRAFEDASRKAEELDLPEDLVTLVTDELENDEQSWDDIVAALVEDAN